jgi:hypothetical protein
MKQVRGRDENPMLTSAPRRGCAPTRSQVHHLVGILPPILYLSFEYREPGLVQVISPISAPGHGHAANPDTTEYYH